MVVNNNLNNAEIFRLNSSLLFESRKIECTVAVSMLVTGICVFVLGYLYLFYLVIVSFLLIFCSIWVIIDNLRITLPIIYFDGITPEIQKIGFGFRKKKELIQFRNLKKIHFPKDGYNKLQITYKNGVQRLIGEYSPNYNKDKLFYDTLKKHIIHLNKTEKDINIKII